MLCTIIQLKFISKLQQYKDKTFFEVALLEGLRICSKSSMNQTFKCFWILPSLFSHDKVFFPAPELI